MCVAYLNSWNPIELSETISIKLIIYSFVEVFFQRTRSGVAIVSPWLPLSCSRCSRYPETKGHKTSWHVAKFNRPFICFRCVEEESGTRGPTLPTPGLGQPMSYNWVPVFQCQKLLNMKKASPLPFFASDTVAYAIWSVGKPDF